MAEARAWTGDYNGPAFITSQNIHHRSQGPGSMQGGMHYKQGGTQQPQAAWTNQNMTMAQVGGGNIYVCG